MRRGLLSSASYATIHNRLPAFTAPQLADLLARVYRQIGLTHLDRYAR